MEKDNYRQIKEPINSDLYSVQNKEYKWGVVDENDNVIVPFGKYAWIDGFQNGLAKVISHSDTSSPNHICTINLETEEIDSTKRAEQGIINESAEEVLPLEYSVWKFYGKDFPTIKTFKNGIEYTQRYELLNPDYIPVDDEEWDDAEDDYAYDSYDRYDDDNDWMRDTWDAMTDGQYGDMPEGFDGDFDFLGF